MAAGTGGHIIPGLAVAREMQARGWTVSWLGTRTGMENRAGAAGAGIPMDTIAFTACAARAWCTADRRACALLGRVLELPAHPARSAGASTRCSAWAATSRSRAA